MSAPPAGFSNQVIEAQRAFRSLLEAMARPGDIRPLKAPAALLASEGANRAPNEPLLPPCLATVLLTLSDRTTPIWLDDALAGSHHVRRFLAFHTGAPIVEDPRRASLAAASSVARLPFLSSFQQGSDDHPDRSTTVLVAVEALSDAPSLVLEGPGIDGTACLTIEPFSEPLVEQLEQNRARYPRGVDLFLVAPGAVAALPRSTIVRSS